MRPLGILLIRRWHPNHAASFGVTPKISHQHAQHALSVEPVSLGTTCPAIDQDAGGFKDIAAHATRGQQTMQPKAVSARFEATGDLTRLPCVTCLACT